MQYAAGNFLWAASDAVGATFTISSLPFQPKAIRVWIVALEEISIAINNPNSTENVNGLRSMGFATSTTNRRCVAAAEQDGAGSMNCFSGFRDDCVAMTLINSSAALASGRLDLDAMLSDGFRLIIDATSGTINCTVQWEAWGGDDITVAEAISIAEPAAAGNQDYPITGFAADGIGQAVMFAGVQNTNASPSESNAFDGGFCLGYAAGTATADNVVVMGNQDDGSASADTDGSCKAGKCLGMIAVTGGPPNAEAQLTQWNADGFRLNWTTISSLVANRRYIALAIKGGLWKAGAYTIAGNSAGATATVSGLAFQPIGIDFIGRMTVEQAAGVSTAEDRMSIGQASSPSSRQALGYLSENGTCSAEVDQIRGTVGILFYPSTAGATQAAYDLDAINADGFRVIVDTAGGVASEWQGFLAFGTAAAPFIDLTRDEAIPIEALRSLLLNVGLPVESLRLLLTLTGIPIESLVSFLAGATIPIESLETHGRVEEIPIDSVAPAVAFTRDEQIPIDSTGTVVRDEHIPIDVLMALLRDETIPVESLRTLLRDPIIPIDVLRSLLRNGEQIPVESSGSVTRRDEIPIDVLGALVRDEDIPIDVLGALFHDEDIPIDVLGSLLRDETIPVESSSQIVLARDEHVPIDSLSMLARLVSIPIDVLGAILRDGSTIPVETLAALLQDSEIPIDVLGTLLRESIIPIDSTGVVFIQRDRDDTIPIDVSGSLLDGEDIPIESQGSLVRDATIPIETIGTARALDVEIPVESIAGQVRDDSLPVDSTGTQVIALDRDEAIPVDSSTVPVAPSAFLVFTPGSPWPPSWLVRAPLLNRTQHQAVLYLGGTSWSTFTGSASPPQPSTIVTPSKPKRIKKPRPQPAHPGYVRAAHTSIIWIGGRSTESVRIDPAAVRQQDEDDIMTLLPLL